MGCTPGIELYAELLLNIRTVTLFGSLRTDATQSTKAEVAVDGETITLTHEGQAASIRLPTKVGKGGTATLDLPRSGPKEVTVRLQLEERMPGLLKFDDQSDDVVPWSASSLSEQTEVQCASCSNVLVRRGNIKTWKDLPSENWAEMMDFWHCHKPAEEDLRDRNGENKGYAATNRLAAVPGTGLVDLLYFLVAEQDCCGLEITSPRLKTLPSQQLECALCGTNVGAVDEQSNGWRLYKWSLAIRTRNEAKFIHYNVQKWIAAHLLAIIESHGTRKFLVRDTENEAETYNLLWIFTPDLSFSSSVDADKRQDPTRAMKVLWQSLSSPQQAESQQGSSIEEIILPKSVCKTLSETLEKSQSLLPASARTFQEWNVGLLQRFSASDFRPGPKAP